MRKTNESLYLCDKTELILKISEQNGRKIRMKTIDNRIF